MNNIGLHGKFEKINENFLNETFDVFGLLEAIQKKYGKTDNDTIINEARDAKDETEEFLEVKQASASANHICATFNDTSLEKADELGKDNITIALAVWSSLKNLLFVVYGKNAAIGPDMKKKIIAATEKGHIRPGTQSISMNDLIFKYGFKIHPVSMAKDDIREFLKGKSGFKTYLIKENRELPFDYEA